jgi:hypothetical protein
MVGIHTMKWGMLVMAITAAVHAADGPGIEVSGRFLTINGTDTVPLGLFGIHASKLSPEQMADWGVTALRVIHRAPDGVPMVSGSGTTPAGLAQIVECFYDRFQPALQLTDPNWQQSLTDLAQRYGAAAKKLGGDHHVEFWNEPYLNWSCKPGVNYDAKHFDVTQASEGAPVTIKGLSQPTEFLTWSRGLRAADATTGAVNYVYAGRMPNGAKPGDTYVFREATYRVEEAWVAKDPTQQFYWAGQQNALWYRQMFLVFAKALKDTNPSVQVSAGWGFNIWNEGWESWKRLYQPLIDEALPLMDGIHEHHYGGETRLVAASYEVVTAYTDERGKRLHFYNTEAGGMLDPEKPDTPAPHVSGSPLQKAQGAMTYFLRDVIHLLDVCPDKAFARAAHEAELNGGDEFAFRLLKPLRGQLIAVTSSHADHWCVASFHADTLSVVCFNDQRQSAEIPFVIHAPAGTTLHAGSQLRAQPRSDGEGMELISAPLHEVRGDTWQGLLEVPGKSAITLVFNVSGTSDGQVQTIINQYFAHGILAPVSTTDSLQRSVSIPPEALASATSARLKMVILNHDGTGTVSINGNVLPLISGSCTVRQNIDVSLLQPDTLLEFATTGSGYTVLMASIELINEE